MIQVSNTINTILTSELGTAVANRIYPIMAPANAAFPYILYKVKTMPVDGTKDGNERIVTAEITVIAKGYAAAHTIADQIEDAFLQSEATLNNADLYDPEFAGEDEDAVEALDVNAYAVMNRINLTQYT